MLILRSRGSCNLKHSSKGTHKCATQSTGYRNYNSQILVSPGLTKRHTPSLNHFPSSKSPAKSLPDWKAITGGSCKAVYFSTGLRRSTISPLLYLPLLGFCKLFVTDCTVRLQSQTVDKCIWAQILYLQYQGSPTEQRFF